MFKISKKWLISFSLIILLIVLFNYPLQAKIATNNNFILTKNKSEETQLILYGGPRTRTPMVEWYLHENRPVMKIDVHNKPTDAIAKDACFGDRHSKIYL